MTPPPWPDQTKKKPPPDPSGGGRAFGRRPSKATCRQRTHCMTTQDKTHEAAASAKRRCQRPMRLAPGPTELGLPLVALAQKGYKPRAAGHPVLLQDHAALMLHRRLSLAESSGNLLVGEPGA